MERVPQDGSTNAETYRKLTLSDLWYTFTALFIWLPVRVFRASLSYISAKHHSESFLTNIKHVVMACSAAHMPVPMIQKFRTNPSSTTIKNSARYMSLQNHIFEHIQRPGFGGYYISRGFDAEPFQAKDADVVIFYMHGGGYILGHPSGDAPSLLFVAEQLAKQGIKAAVFGLRYTLIPEKVFPSQINEAMEAYRWLIDDLEVPPSKIFLAGESAGGHLALSLLISLHQQASQPESKASCPAKPASVFLISPWCDLLTSNPKSIHLNSHELDSAAGLRAWGNMTLQNLNSTDKKLFQNFAERVTERGSWKDILPLSVWVSAGANEAIFIHDVDDFVQHARSDGVKVLYEVEEGGGHAWQNHSAKLQHALFLGMPFGTDDPSLMRGYRRLAQVMVEVLKDNGFVVRSKTGK